MLSDPGGTGDIRVEGRLPADLALSLGRMVWPHMLVRVMLAEQIYRSEEGRFTLLELR